MNKLHVGDWVEVRSKDEILATLDSNGELNGMPFMPEMLKFCGRKFQVYKRAHKTCDTVFPIRGRWVEDAIHLDTRCDGQAHGGCQAACLLFWKVDWLKPAEAPTSEKALPAEPVSSGSKAKGQGGFTEEDLQRKTQAAEKVDGEIAYSCQATRLPYYTTALSPWDLRQYVEDYSSGNVGIWRLFCGFMYATYYNISEAGIGVGRPMRWLYDATHRLWGGTLFPRHSGPIRYGDPTPALSLNLQEGEIVRVKPHREILKTLNTESRNRGMAWDAELVPYCGGTYRVLRRVSKILDEKSGKMVDMKTPCIVLDSVVCEARYSGCRMFCPRHIYAYWREIWLERVTDSSK